MLEKIIHFSIHNKLIVILFTLTIAGFGLYSIVNISVGAVPDITNNQVQVITTSSNLSTQEIEQYITAPVEMEMANLPGVEEIRSISKFGISLVTIVFDEKLGTYLPRQLIAEKIKTATANIPEGFGEPEMGPITTGLGEIYQYTLDPEEGYEQLYTAEELRTLQDWVIKRRLSGIPGVVEINSWGGYLKQYEVRIQPAQLEAMGVTLMEVFDALEANNSISGGSYIEKTNQSYFIRGDGQMGSLEDIANSVVCVRNGVPVRVRQVAEVGYGHANRYGAITANGKGETILGQVMMLKDADSKEVIQAVHERINEIRKNLPEGIQINPIVDRSELVAKTTFTVAENLILGAIIVMLTVMLLLGNLRSALVITSVIPLALLFTISMMYIFGIDANLMSLGALDFGIIIDGAVIIVEFIALRMWAEQTSLGAASEEERLRMMDRISMTGATKMMKSAIFGQIIILIVFIPILSLTGVEGKMFKPMALSFSFAIMGAMILGLTWVPVASSLFLKPAKGSSVLAGISNRFMGFVQKAYEPSLKWSCAHKRWVLGAAVASLVLTGVLFARMGGEFVPTLDEGDFVIQPVLKTGTSLSKTIETTTQMEQILLKTFPEVDKVVSRIGAAEVPTDPMSMEEIDMIIKLHPRSSWTTARNKEDLAEAFKEALSVIPGIEYEFTQPIEMRFNELITGVRSDIAIKIFGEDLDYIDRKAIEIKELIQDIPGAGDIILEKTAGLPQIKIDYNRSKVAYYGLTIQTLNDYLSAAFAGATAGVVFEGERRFDLVLRLDQRHRVDIQNIQQLKIPLANGNQIPLSEVADIEYAQGPAKISRENAHRRVVVGVNVRNRDLQSVVTDIRRTLDDQLTLQTGTYLEYGGQFENLQNASNRLLVAVPVALLLIFIFLHFAFKSLKDAVMIFTAIPLATVGGVLLLWIRGMPFSVSAGVGFIALFGIAVLNGIVLIEHLKELQRQGTLSMQQVILQGTRDRLRPVLLTAGAAAMGFLPMALSTGAGAEVQRPLATVVIGGLFTSTMLTLIALPLMFELFYNVVGLKLFPFRVIRSNACCSMLLLFLLPAASLMAQDRTQEANRMQEQTLTLDQAVHSALQNSPYVKALRLQTEADKTRPASEWEATTIQYGVDENNLAANNYPLWVWGIEQSMQFPSLYVVQSKVKTIESRRADLLLEQKLQRIRRDVSSAYLHVQRYNEQQALLEQTRDLYRELLQRARAKHRLGEIAPLELLHLEAKYENAVQAANQWHVQREQAYAQLQQFMGVNIDFDVTEQMHTLAYEHREWQAVPDADLLKNNEQLQQTRLQLEQHKMLPDLSFQYFLGTNRQPNAAYYHGFEAGLSIPLLFGSQRKNIQASKRVLEASRFETQHQMEQLALKQRALLNRRALLMERLDYYKENGARLYDEIVRSASLKYETGEIDIFQFANSLETAQQIKIDYLNNLLDFNQITLELNYLTNE